jgi:hypothetical protein
MKDMNYLPFPITLVHPLPVFGGVRVLILLYFSGVRCFCVLLVFVLCLVCPMLPVSLDCSFLVFSTVDFLVSSQLKTSSHWPNFSTFYVYVVFNFLWSFVTSFWSGSDSFPSRTWISNVICHGLFCVLLRWEVIVCFVDIGVIVDHHFLFIIQIKPKLWYNFTYEEIQINDILMKQLEIM